MHVPYAVGAGLGVFQRLYVPATFQLLSSQVERGLTVGGFAQLLAVSLQRTDTSSPSTFRCWEESIKGMQTHAAGSVN